MKENKKRGRPAAGTGKNVYVGARFDESEHALLEQMASNTGETESEIIRKAVKFYSTVYQHLG